MTSWTKKDQELADMLLALTIASSNLPMTFVHNSIFKIYVSHLNHQVIFLLLFFHDYMCKCFRQRLQVY